MGPVEFTMKLLIHSIVEAYEWIDDLMPLFVMDVITYPFRD